MSTFNVGQTAWIIESAFRLREVCIFKISGNLASVRFTDNLSGENGGIRIPVSRLFADKEEAERELKKKPKC